MKYIELTQGKRAIVDDEDFEWLNQWKWHASDSGFGFYAKREFNKNKIRNRIRMHRLIMDAPDNKQVDHINGNRLDNRRHNLRTCTNMQNSWNSARTSGSMSGFKGVSWHRNHKKWRTTITCNGKNHYLGYFFCVIKAAKAYDTKAIELFGEFARTNF